MLPRDREFLGKASHQSWIISSYLSVSNRLPSVQTFLIDVILTREMPRSNVVIGIRRPACRTSSAGDKPQPYIFLSIAGVAGTV